MIRSSFVKLQCHACRCNILQSFVSIGGISSSHPAPQQAPLIITRPFQRLFSQSWRRLQSNEEVEPIPAEAEQAHDNPQELPVKSLKESSSFVPWYLQIPSAATPAPRSPIADRQRLPPLPENAPPLLSPLMTYLFDTAGLDDLSIIDLRHLDPPPALGANLIMIIGTARSIKHLNVCADRCARWLRSEYKLRPKADGLLGRNELKIKLRRRMKRAKLAASVGRQLDDTNRDDGITTGWVCLNVGTVPDDGIQDTEEATIEEEGGGFVGFGVQDKGPKIVIQMLTEEKRSELDLEGLWQFRQNRKAEKEEKALAGGDVDDLEQDVDGVQQDAMSEMNPPPPQLRDSLTVG